MGWIKISCLASEIAPMHHSRAPLRSCALRVTIETQSAAQTSVKEII